jgi:hypothetical protein
MLLPNFRPKRKTGFTLMETAATVGFVGVFIAVLITVSSNVLNLVRTAKDNISASQTLQQRVEDVRLATWGQIWNPTLMAAEIMGIATPSSAGLSEPIETVVVSPYPAKTGFTPAQLVRQNGVTTVVSSNPALKTERLLRVDFMLTWKGFPKKRDRARTASILVANRGAEN